MEEQTNKPLNLFAPSKNGPMQFAIIRNSMLNIECQRVKTHILNHGGEFMGFDPQGNEYLNLASPKYKALPEQIVFDVKYVKSCVREKKLLDLANFQISGTKFPPCPAFIIVSQMERCKHYQTPEEVLAILNGKYINECTKGSNSDVSLCADELHNIAHDHLR